MILAFGAHRRRDLIRRELHDEVEFVTIMWFDGIDSIKAFMGDDYTVSHVPPAAQAVLSHFDPHAAHYTVIDRRTQPPPPCDDRTTPGFTEG